jgi:phospholipid transport system substrate-binding protein
MISTTSKNSKTWKIWSSSAAAALACATMLVALPGTAASQTILGPTAVIEDIVKRALAVLNDPDLVKVERVAALEAIALEHFDFRTMSKLVLAKYWKRFSKEQQKEFQTEFKDYLSRNYGSRIDRFDQEKVEILGEREEPRGDVTVFTRVVGGEFNDAVINYRLRKRKDLWRVIDVIVEGISFVSNYRDQFREVLSEGGPDYLLAKLREKNLQDPDTDEG